MGPRMIDQLDCVETLENWCACLDSTPPPAPRGRERILRIAIREPVVALLPSRELESWLIRSGLSPQANLPANRIGLYTDFV